MCISKAGVIFVAGICAGSQAYTQPMVDVAHYDCPASQDLSVHRSAHVAQVSLGGRTYVLKRKPSSIGDKYLTQKAALIIDGDSAVFVADGHLDLGTCRRAVPVAAAR